MELQLEEDDTHLRSLYKDLSPKVFFFAFLTDRLWPKIQSAVTSGSR